MTQVLIALALVVTLALAVALALRRGALRAGMPRSSRRASECNEGADREAVLSSLYGLHAEVDARSREIAAGHRGRLHCGPGCADCCRDELTVFEVEAERIRRRHGVLLREGAPHPAGACAFLDLEARGICRIYPDRPYVCRTQGLPLRWIVEDEEPRVGAKDRTLVEHRDICPLNLAGPALEELDAESCWLLGPVEARLAVLEERFSAGEPRRVALRRLFVLRG